MVMFLVSMVKFNSTEPVVSPVLSNREPGRPDLLMPNKANSMARSMLLFPEPMSPDKRTEPSGNSMVSLMYERMLVSFRVLRNIE